MLSFEAYGDCFRFLIYDDRFGYAHFDTEQERDMTFWNARYIDQKHWWVGDPRVNVLRAWPRKRPTDYQVAS